MQGQESQGPKVVSIFTKKKTSEAKQEPTQASASAPTSGENPPSFAELMKQNQANKERLAKERATANKSVLRSYRIKH